MCCAAWPLRCHTITCQQQNSTAEGAAGTRSFIHACLQTGRSCEGLSADPPARQVLKLLHSDWCVKQTSQPATEHTSDTRLTVLPVALQVLTLLHQDLKSALDRSQRSTDQPGTERRMQIMTLISDVGHCLRAADHKLAGQPVWRGSKSANWSKCAPFAEEVSCPSGDGRRVGPALV